MNNIITLLVNGAEYAGWTSATIKIGIEQAARAFELDVTEQWQYAQARLPILEGDSCQIYIDGTLVLSGFVDVHNENETAQMHTVSVSGRSKTQDIIDCSSTYSPGNFKDVTVLDVANVVCGEYGVGVTLGDNVSLPLKQPLHELEPGESPFECTERLARKHAVLLRDDAAGNLLLDRAGSSSYGFELSDYRVINIKRDASRQYSRYVAKAQRRGENDDNPLDAAQVTAEVSNSAVQRNRVKIIRPEGNTNTAHARQRLEWQKAVDIGAALEISATMRGFYHPAGALWDVNRLIFVNLPQYDVVREMLISSVQFSKSDQGSLTELVLKPPEAFVSEPPAPEARTAGNKGKSTTSKKAFNYFDL